MEFSDLALLWWFLLYSVVVYITVLVLRRVLERIWVSLKTNKTWRDVVLVAIPPVLGGVAAYFLKDFSVLEEAKMAWVRVGLGMTAGFFSSASYRFVHTKMKERGLELPSPDDLPSSKP